jgi:thiol-disulfide isomerase/thioredoxin
MDVELYVYDLSKGLARQMSQQFLGIQIDAVYHTAIVLEGIEYFYGQGIQSTTAGNTHHGRPMEIIKLGRTQLPVELTLEYLDSLKSIYTAESYDLFMHNCNNFTHDFAMFLVGSGIPAHITSLPQTVLNTPFGQMLRPMLDQSMRSVTQAPVVSVPRPSAAPKALGAVKNITVLSELEKSLEAATQSCAVIFFTSSTCGPCKVLYPIYDELAQEAGDKATLIKVDINYAQEIAAKYNVRATPTIQTFLKGEKEEEWAGADVQRLKSSVEYLIRTAHPPHPHTKLSIYSLVDSASKPVRYQKVPPLDKLITKLGPLSTDPSLLEMKSFLNGLHSSIQQGTCQTRS